jgi:hypothetical protein
MDLMGNDWGSMLEKAFILLFLLGTSLVLVSQGRQWYRLRHINGPWLATTSELWNLRSVLGGDYWKDLGMLCEKYGV